GGPAFVTEMTAATSASAGEVALAYAAVRDVYGLTALNAEVDALDGVVPGAVQLALYGQIAALLRRETLWFLRNGNVTTDIEGLVARHRAGVDQLRAVRDQVAGAGVSDAIAARARGMVTHGVPEAL